MEPCDVSGCDVIPLGGLKPKVLLDLIYLMVLLEEQGWLPAHSAHTRKSSEGNMKENEIQRGPAENLPSDVSWLIEDERKHFKEKNIETDSFPSQSVAKDATKIIDCSELPCPNQSPKTSQSSKIESFALELRAVRVSYLLIGALKSLTRIFSCEKLSDLLQVPKNDPPNSSITPFSSPNPEQTKATSRQWDESAELRSVLQYAVQSMVKWAVRPCPIKQTVSLADLERAQIMIYKGAISRLQGDKEDKGNASVLM